MRSVAILTIAIVAILCLLVSATIINVPDDYLTIQEGIDVGINGDTVLVENGTYTGDGNRDIDFSGKAILLQSINGPDSTIINCGGFPHRGFIFHNAEDSFTVVNGFSIINGFPVEPGGGIYCTSGPKIINCKIKNNSSGFDTFQAGYGGGIYAAGSSFILENCEISNNRVFDGDWQGHPIYGKGSGIYSTGANTVIENCIFRNNGGLNGSAIYAQSSDLLVGDCTFNSNSIYVYDTNISITNTIIWNTHAPRIVNYDSSLVDISYCDIQDSLWPGEGNISNDPLFCDPEDQNYWLAENSPCVGAGCDSLGNPDTSVNIGAFGIGCDPVDIFEKGEILPFSVKLDQNYPNPFNASTVIKYALPQQSRIRIEIYDILGRKVNTLIDKQQPAGYHQAIWHADVFSSGMYFYKLQAGDYIETKKMLLLK